VVRVPQRAPVDPVLVVPVPRPVPAVPVRQQGPVVPVRVHRVPLGPVETVLLQA
jgi:hypothetical protein